MTKVKLKVSEGRAVVDPATMRYIGPEGIEINALNSYWTRRLRDGDVQIVHVVEAPKVVKEEKTKKSKGEG